MSIAQPHTVVAVLAFAPDEHILSKLELVGFLHIGCTGRRSDLGTLFPSDVLWVPWHSGFDGVREREECLGSVESLVHFLLSDAMVNNGEETDPLSRITNLKCYVVESAVKVTKRYLRRVLVRL